MRPRIAIAISPDHDAFLNSVHHNRSLVLSVLIKRTRPADVAGALMNRLSKMRKQTPASQLMKTTVSLPPKQMAELEAMVDVSGLSLPQLISLIIEHQMNDLPADYRPSTDAVSATAAVGARLQQALAEESGPDADTHTHKARPSLADAPEMIPLQRQPDGRLAFVTPNTGP